MRQEPNGRLPIALPFTGLSQDVAVDSAGNIYVTDYGSNQVLKLAAQSRGRKAGGQVDRAVRPAIWHVSGTRITKSLKNGP